MKPLPFNALAKILNQKSDCQTLISGAAIDSRQIKPGNVFFALPGDRVDGHHFLKEAAQKNAAGAVVKTGYNGPDFGLNLLFVDDVLDSLQNFARQKLQKRSCKVVAITGSIGKTTTKEFAASLLKSKFRVFSSPLSYNSQATLPLSILMSDETEEILILEMGMSQPGQIKKLVSIAPPYAAILTSVAWQHANHFNEGLLAIGREKAEIFSDFRTQFGVINKDILNFEEANSIGNSTKKNFSLKDPSAEYFLKISEDRVRVYDCGLQALDLPHFLPQKAHYQNFLAAAALARLFDISWQAIQEGAHLLKLPKMRFEKTVKKGVLFINDAYNANPDSMLAALQSLPEPSEGGRKIAVLSEMVALGSYSEEGHIRVAKTALAHADVLFCIGERAREMSKLWGQGNRQAFHFNKKEDLQKSLNSYVRQGDVVLLKGARSYCLDEILNQF